MRLISTAEVEKANVKLNWGKNVQQLKWSVELGWNWNFMSSVILLLEITLLTRQIISKMEKNSVRHLEIVPGGNFMMLHCQLGIHHWTNLIRFGYNTFVCFNIVLLGAYSVALCSLYLSEWIPFQDANMKYFMIKPNIRRRTFFLLPREIHLTHHKNFTKSTNQSTLKSILLKNVLRYDERSHYFW